MRRNMKEWKESILNSNEAKAMPIMTYPGLSLINRQVRDMVTDGNVQYRCIKALSLRYPSVASETTVMALYVEAEAFGSRILYNDDEIPTVSGRLLNSLNDVVNLKVPEIGAGKTYEYLKAARLASANIYDRPVFGGMIGPFSLAGRLFDVTEMMIAILDNPKGSHQLLKKCNEFLIKYARAFKEAGCNGIVIAEPAAGLLSEIDCSEFSSEYVKQIVDHVQDEDFLVILHNCGNTLGLVNSMLSTGCDGYHFGNAVDISNIIKKVPSDKLVMGNIDPVRIKEGSPESIKKETFELLKKMKGFNNFILSSGCDIPPGTPLKNIDSIFVTVENYNKKSLISNEESFINYGKSVSDSTPGVYL